jgi:P4 family phage/plasmid primase-like protien
MAKAGAGRDDVINAVLEATMNAPGVDVAKWDLRAEEKKIGGAYDSAVAKFDITPTLTPNVSRETPKTTATPTGPAAPIGAEEVGNVVPFSTGKKRKAAAPKGDHQLQAAFLVADGLIETLRRDGQDIMLAEGDVWLYRDGFWRVTTPADEQQLRTIIQQGFEDLGEAAKGNTLTLAWKRLTEHPKLYKANVPWAGAGMIVCRNGVILPDIDAPDGWRFEAHKPENYARRHIGAEYDPGIDCPQFVALLESMFSDRLDAHLAISLVQEWLGGALAIATLKREQRRALIPVGPSRTGKTELTMICKALLGNPIATPSAKEFGERFGLETLYGAVAWIRDDAINEGDRLDPQRFKTVVTGEAIDIDRKNKPAVRDVRLDLPVLLTANSLARVRDSTDAVFNRSIILTMTNVISIEAAHAARVAAGVGEQSIGQAVFEREASGILNWALDGLVRLRKRGFYSIPESIKAAITQYKDDNNPVGQWAREALEADPDHRVARSDVVRAYNGWELEQEGEEAHAHGARWLLPRLRNQIKGLGDYQTHEGTRYITGIKLTKLGLAMWTSYGVANPRNGPGGLSTSASEVNRLHKVGIP